MFYVTLLKYIYIYIIQNNIYNTRRAFYSVNFEIDRTASYTG